jgi:hypothetical protein
MKRGLAKAASGRPYHGRLAHKRESKVDAARPPLHHTPITLCLAAFTGAGENHHLVLGHAIEQRVGLLVQEVLVYAFRPEAGDA